MVIPNREKALGQFKLQVTNSLSPFNGYGLNIYIPEVVNEIVHLALQLHERLSGRDIPIGTHNKKIDD